MLHSRNQEAGQRMQLTCNRLVCRAIATQWIREVSLQLPCNRRAIGLLSINNCRKCLLNIKFIKQCEEAAKSLENRSVFALQSLHNCYTIAVQSIRNRRENATKSSKVVAQSLRNRRAIDDQLLRKRSAVTLQNVRNRFAITSKSLSSQCVVAL
jgi:hypothetical protein